MGKIGWLAAFIYCAGAALRLARFNTQVGVADKRFFQGLASPAAAALIAGSVWLGQGYGVSGHDIGILVALVTAVAGLLMVSNFRYHSFKEVDWRGKVNFLVILLVVAVFVVISVEPALILCLLFYLYALSGLWLPFAALENSRCLMSLVMTMRQMTVMTKHQVQRTLPFPMLEITKIAITKRAPKKKKIREIKRAKTSSSHESLLKVKTLGCHSKGFYSAKRQNMC